MRLVLPLLLLLLGFALVYFVITNPSERVGVTLGNNYYPEVKLSLVVLIALMVGAGFTGVIALIEGATIRLVNRRLRREMQRLESENSSLRSQRSSSGPGSDFVEPPLEPPPPVTVEAGYDQPPSAPVYEPDKPETRRAD